MSCTMIFMLLDAIWYFVSSFILSCFWFSMCGSLRAARRQPRITHRVHLRDIKIIIMLIILIGTFLACYPPNFLYIFVWLFHTNGFYSSSFRLVIRVLRGAARIRVMVNYVSTGLTCRYFLFLKKFRKTQMHPPHGTKLEPYIGVGLKMNTYLILDVNVWNAIGCNVTKTYASNIFKNELSNALSHNVNVWPVASCNVRCREYETYFIEMQIKMSWTILHYNITYL